MDAPGATPPGLEPIVAEIARVSSYLWERGWAERNAGNLSVDVTGVVPSSWQRPATNRALPAHIPSEALRGAVLLVTAAGARFRDVQRAPRESLLLVRVLETLDGVRVLWPDGSELRPTSELAAHLHVHARMRARNQPFRALLHTHPTQLIALSHAPGIGRSPDRISRILWSMVPEVKVLLPEGAAVVPYALPGGEALATATADALVERRLVLWEKHGCVAIERSVTEAFDLVDTLEKAAGVYLLCRAAGYEPEGLDPDALDGLAALASDDRTEP